jgi:hypothetical protein
VGDFNKDGVPDLAVANKGEPVLGLKGDVSVLLGNGDGSFQAALTFTVGKYPGSVAVGDFDGDGVPDLAVANGGSDSVSVLLGNGDGTFHKARNFATGAHPVSVVVSDFNADGVPDLAVVVNASVSGAVGRASVLLGNGNGTFQAAWNFGAGVGPSSAAVSDFNGDGKPDLAVANLVSVNVSVLINNTPPPRHR